MRVTIWQKRKFSKTSYAETVHGFIEKENNKWLTLANAAHDDVFVMLFSAMFEKWSSDGWTDGDKVWSTFPGKCGDVLKASSWGLEEFCNERGNTQEAVSLWSDWPWHATLGHGELCSFLEVLENNNRWQEEALPSLISMGWGVLHILGGVLSCFFGLLQPWPKTGAEQRLGLPALDLRLALRMVGFLPSICARLYCSIELLNYP